MLIANVLMWFRFAHTYAFPWLRRHPRQPMGAQEPEASLPEGRGTA